MSDSEARHRDQEVERIARSTVAADLAAEQAISDEALTGHNAQGLIRLMRQRAARQYRGRTIGEMVFGLQKLQLELTYNGAKLPDGIPKRQRPELSELDISSPVFGGYTEADAAGMTSYGWQLQLSSDPTSWYTQNPSLAVLRAATRNGRTESSWRYTVYPHERPGRIVHSEQFGSILGIHDHELEAMQQAAYAANPQIVELRAAHLEVTRRSLIAEGDEANQNIYESIVTSEKLRKLEADAIRELPLAGPRATHECLQVTQLALQQLNFK